MKTTPAHNWQSVTPSPLDLPAVPGALSNYDAYKLDSPPEREPTPTEILARHAPRMPENPTHNDLLSCLRFLRDDLENDGGTVRQQVYAAYVTRWLERKREPEIGAKR